LTGIVFGDSAFKVPGRDENRTRRRIRLYRHRFAFICGFLVGVCRVQIWL